MSYPSSPPPPLYETLVPSKWSQMVMYGAICRLLPATFKSPPPNPRYLTKPCTTAPYPQCSLHANDGLIEEGLGHRPAP
jgi:hypothetical protein